MQNNRPAGAQRRGIAALLGGVSVLFCASLVFASSSEWWRPEWTWRRRIAVSGAPIMGSGPRFGYVSFPLPADTTGDGADVRLVDSKGRELPREVKLWDPAVGAIVAFKIPPQGDTLYVYWGNPAAGAPSPSWRAEAGVFLKTEQNARAVVHNFRQMKELLESSDDSDGAGYVPRVYSGFNPFGPSDHVLASYTGYFHALFTGRYGFSTASTDASFLRVDGTLVAQWPGRHGAGGGSRAQHRGTIDLTEGIHKLEYDLAHGMGRPMIAVAGWRLPGDKIYRLMLPGDFVPIEQATALEPEKRGEPFTAAFLPQILNCLVVDRHVYTKVRFMPSCSPPGTATDSIQWDFGDGATAKGPSVDHIFFSPSDYTVSMTASDQQDHHSTARQVVRLRERILSQDQDVIWEADRLAETVAQTPLDSLRTDDLRNAAWLLAYRHRAGPLLPVLRLILKRATEGKNRLEMSDLELVETGLLPSLDSPARTERLLRDMLALPRLERKVEWTARLDLAEFLARFPTRTDDAAQTLDGIDAAALDKLPGPLQRRYWMIRGDIAWKRRKADDAFNAYRRAEDLNRPEWNKPYDIASFAFNARDLISRKEYSAALDSIDDWERQRPTERLRGQSSLLRARCLVGLGEDGQAEAILQTAIELCRPGPYQRELIQYAIDLCTKKGEKEKADSYRHLLEQHYQTPPASPAPDSSTPAP